MQDDLGEDHCGSCLCGAVRIRISGPLSDVIACHCSQCRKQTGLHYAATNVATADLSVEGGDNVSWYKASPTASRGFCRTCGSALFWVGSNADQISVMAGLFDTPTELKIGYHIFCADKSDFYEITDGLPQFPQAH